MISAQQGPTISPAQMEILHGRAISLREVIAKLEAQRPIIQRQTQVGDPALQREAASQVIQMDLQIAGARAELSSVQSQIEAAGGRVVRYTEAPARPPRPDGFWSRIDSDAITAVFIMTSLAILVPLSIGLLRRAWRQPAPKLATEPFDDMKLRMERLEQAIDTVAIEIERVAESQRFVAKVLVDRPAATPAAASSVDSPQSIGEAKPFLALGAGPVEPIPVAQRQAVRQSITPH